MSSGVPVHPDVTQVFNKINKRELAAAILKLTDKNDEIIVDKTIPVADDPTTEWSAILDALDADESRYVIADYKVKETATVTKSKIVFILYSAENAGTFKKMVYASSRESAATALSAAKSIQVTELEEMSYDAIKDAVYGK